MSGFFKGGRENGSDYRPVLDRTARAEEAVVGSPGMRTFIEIKESSLPAEQDEEGWD